MRQCTYVPQRIASAETRAAVTILCNAIEQCGAMSYADAEQSLCRLLGWMCQQDVENEFKIEVN